MTMKVPTAAVRLETIDGELHASVIYRGRRGKRYLAPRTKLVTDRKDRRAQVEQLLEDALYSKLRASEGVNAQ